MMVELIAVFTLARIFTEHKATILVISFLKLRFPIGRRMFAWIISISVCLHYLLCQPNFHTLLLLIEFVANSFYLTNRYNFRKIIKRFVSTDYHKSIIVF